MMVDPIGERGRAWIPDTRFGEWFQRTEVWRRYVVGPALDEFQRLLGSDECRFPVVLDAGCGSGRVFDEICARFHAERIVGVDIDPVLIERAHEAVARCSRRVDLLRADLSRLDLPDATFDLVLCHQTLHHVVDQAAVLSQLFRVLKPGGLLLFAESCDPFIHSIPVRLLFRHPRHVQRSAEGYLALLRAAGFSFVPDAISLPDPFWARPGFGIFESLGAKSPARRGPTELQVIARRRVEGPGQRPRM